MTKQEITNILRSVFAMQLLTECLDDVSDIHLWKHDLKKYGNLYQKQLDKVVNAVLESVDEEELENYNFITKQLREKLLEITHEEK